MIKINLSKVNIDKKEIQKSLNNDAFGKFVADQWKNYIDPYTPRSTGNLMRNVEIQPFGILYNESYAEEVYFNPYGKNFIREGAGRNPYATDHWDVAAAEAGQLDKLYRVINKALAQKKF